MDMPQAEDTSTELFNVTGEEEQAAREVES
jgi:hypothetical protein